ncbi:MAG: hypothetical protein E7588_09365 [Ruminococcaceae bacterium]|nr:hypothetical protein [Oscillospiraceae bacterium]
MADEIDMTSAMSVYNTICTTLDNMGLTYKKHEEKLVITLGHQGEDMVHDILIIVNAKQQAITMLEHLPFRIDDEKVVDMCIAICCINKGLISGGFTYGLGNEVDYEITQFCNDVEISEGFVERMIMTLVMTVEEYDDKLMALNKGYIKATDFLDEE